MIEHNVENFISELADKGRILLIGGLAVIAHGLSRGTKDADIWFEPFESPKIWAEKINSVMKKFKDASLFDVFENKNVRPENLADHVDQKKMIRINGLERWLDVFREPHNLEYIDFESSCEHAKLSHDKYKIMDEIDLLLTKDGTKRKQDESDIVFLMGKTHSRFKDILENGSYEDVKAIFDRYIDLRTCEASMKNPNKEVRELSLQMIQLIADGGDMFAKTFLEKLKDA